MESFREPDHCFSCIMHQNKTQGKIHMNVKGRAKGRSSFVMLSKAKHLVANRDRLFASLKVTRYDCSNGQGLFFTIDPC